MGSQVRYHTTRSRLADSFANNEHSIRNIRSESILFFHKGEVDNTLALSPAAKQFDYQNPLIEGFNNARSDYISFSSQDAQAYRGCGMGDPVTRAAATNLVLDYYQHPAKLSDPSLPYRRLYDLYSLGCVLLDLGLWTTLDGQVGVGGSTYEVMRAIRQVAREPVLDR